MTHGNRTGAPPYRTGDESKKTGDGEGNASFRTTNHFLGPTGFKRRGRPVQAWLGYAIAALLIALYVGIVLFLHRTGRLGPDQRFTLFGPLLMIKTRAGRGFIDRVGRYRRTWSALADLGLVLAAAAMVVIVVTLLLEAAVAARIPPSQVPQPLEAVGLPGINPVIPLGYGLVAIVIGIVIHELFHGFVARSQRIGVKSLGVLFLVVPMGAFVEQDDQEMQLATRRSRGRVAAAGIFANFVVALVTFLLLGLVLASGVHANATGVGVAVVESNTPAANASIRAGDIITAVNGTATPTDAIFLTTLEKSHPGDTLSITYYRSGQSGPTTVYPTLTTFPGKPGRGFLGVAITTQTPAELLGVLYAPWSSPEGPLAGFLTWLVLPFAQIEPVQGSTASFYHVTGPLAAFGAGDFWVVGNLLYWLTWMNLLLGLSNALPLIPLDGGLLFRDWMAGIVHRLRRGWDGKKLDDVAGRLTVAASLIVVFLLLWQFVAPRL
jgi:membrane-associated protease RseP (regulator of RpoE activity)